MGDLPSSGRSSCFSETIRIGVAAGADLVLIETMSDSYVAKAAVLAAKESCDLPVVVTTIFDEKGKRSPAARWIRSLPCSKACE